MIKRYLRSNLCWGALSLVVSGFAFGQSQGYSDAPYPAWLCAAGGPAATAGADTTRVEADRIFLREAAITGILEVKMSRIAVLRANSSQVRQFAQRMADNQARANRKLKEIAWAKDLEICNEMDGKRAQLLLALQRHTGDDFDREYLTLQVDQHRRAVRLFQQQAAGGSDGDFRNFAESKLPALEAHLQEASLLADSR